MRVAIYARVSTTDQDCAIQIERLRAEARTRDWVIHDIYSDARSGTSNRRPGRDRLLADAAKHCFDAVIVWRLDRWGRSVQDVLQTLRDLARLKIAWHAIDQNLTFDEQDSLGRFLLTILAAVAELELSLRRERCREGIAHMKEHGSKTGRPTGRPPACFDRAKAYEDRKRGMLLPDLAKKYGYSESTIHRALTAYARQTGQLPPFDESAHDANKASSTWVRGRPGTPTRCEICGEVQPGRRAAELHCPEERAKRRKAQREAALARAHQVRRERAEAVIH